MTIPAELAELRERLDEAGMIVVEEPDRLTVRLAYFCSVQIRMDEGRLRFAPFFGLVPRTRSTLIKLIGGSMAILLAFKYGVPYALGIFAFAMMTMMYDVVRTAVTENAITRASLIYAQQVRDARSAAGLRAAGTPLLGERTPRIDTMVRPRDAVVDPSSSYHRPV